MKDLDSSSSSSDYADVRREKELIHKEIENIRQKRKEDTMAPSMIHDIAENSKKKHLQEQKEKEEEDALSVEKHSNE